MANNYPSTISAFTNPSSSDKLSTSPHSSIETAQNTDLIAIETFVGTLSSNVGTLVYDIRASASNGGGHVQTANKGGTGQTTFNKGDILVATSSSVLTKLAVSGNDNDILAVNSSVATGVNWTPGATGGQVQAQAFSYSPDSGTGSVYAIYPNPCVISYSGGQLFSFQAAQANTVIAPALSVSSLVSKTIKNPDGTALYAGQIPASAMTVVQYQGNASVFHLISPKNGNAISQFANGLATRAGDTVSGVQNIAHGLGVVPKKVRILARKSLNAVNNSLATSDGTYNGTTNSCIWTEIVASTDSSTGAESGVGSNGVVIRDVAGGGTMQTAIITFDATNIILTWTKTGTPSANTIQMIWEAEA